MSNSIALFSLIVLVACIAIGFALKKNVGLIAVLAAAVFGSAAGYTDSQIIKGFSSSTFIMLLGVSLLCTIATNNGTLELAAKKFLRLSGGHVAITPVIIYLIGYIVAAIGPGCVPALGIAAALSLPLGKSTGYNSVMLAAIGQIGSMAGRFSPITPESVLIYNLASEQGITGYQTHTLIYATITTIVLSFVIFLVFKGFRIKEPQSKEKRDPSRVHPEAGHHAGGLSGHDRGQRLFQAERRPYLLCCGSRPAAPQCGRRKGRHQGCALVHPDDGHRHRYADEHCL